MTTFSRSTNNSRILVSDKHEAEELKAIEKIASMEETDPEAIGYVEYHENCFSNICIVPLFDLHIGGEGTKLKRLIEIVNFIKRTPNAVCVLGGDVLDNATLSGATNAHTSKVNPDRALDLAVKILEPIKNKILLSVGGNHDSASGDRNKDSNVALAKQLSKRLGVKYFPFNAIARIKLPIKNAKKKRDASPFYNVFITHGSGSAGNKAGTLDKAIAKAMLACKRTEVIPDLILTGHFHADVDGIYNVSVPVYIEGYNKGIKQKMVRVESVGTMQEANSYAVASGFDITKSNMYAINVCMLKNPLYNEKSQDYEFEQIAQTTKFPILKQNKLEFTRIATEYMQAYAQVSDIETMTRQQYSGYTINDLVDLIKEN